MGARQLGFELSPREVSQFQAYYEELVAWNSRMNLTTVTGYDEVQLKHFLDSLTLSLVWPHGGASLRTIDVGTGAGLPGLPLKIIFPSLSLVLLDATAKKADFLRCLVERLGLADVEVVTGRAEEVAHRTDYRERFDMVFSRAVAPLATLAELALPFSRIGGDFIAQKKGDITVELAGAEEAIRRLGGRLREVRPVELAELADERKLVVISKVARTPEAYPRRTGIPAKRPLTIRLAQGEADRVPGMEA